jgi:hypothetical protein
MVQSRPPPFPAIQKCIDSFDEKLLIAPPLPDSVDLQPLVARGIEAHSDGYRACEPVRNRHLALGSRGRNCHRRRCMPGAVLRQLA